MKLYGIPTLIFNQPRKFLSRLAKKQRRDLLKHLQALVWVYSSSNKPRLTIKGSELEDDINCPHCKSLEIIEHHKIEASKDIVVTSVIRPFLYNTQLFGVE